MRHDNLFGGPTTVGLSAFLCALVMTPIANGGQIVIDSFNEPSSGEAFFLEGPAPGSANPILFEHSGLTEVIGSERDCLIEVVGNPTPISASGIIGYEPVYNVGALQINTHEPGTRVTLQYDGFDDDAAGLRNAGGLGATDLTEGGTNGRIRFHFYTVDTGGPDAPPLSLKVSVNGEDPVEFGIPEGNDFDFFVPFSDFRDGLFSSVDSLMFGINDLVTPIPNIDFKLDYIEVESVPEPSSLALLSGLATCLLVALARRRRQTS